MLIDRDPKYYDHQKRSATRDLKAKLGTFYLKAKTYILPNAKNVIETYIYIYIIRFLGKLGNVIYILTEYMCIYIAGVFFFT